MEATGSIHAHRLSHPAIRSRWVARVLVEERVEMGSVVDEDVFGEALVVVVVVLALVLVDSHQVGSSSHNVPSFQIQRCVACSQIPSLSTTVYSEGRQRWCIADAQRSCR